MKLFLVCFLLGWTLLSLISFGVLTEFIDPAFIGSPSYNFFLFKILPVSSLLTFFAGVYFCLSNEEVKQRAIDTYGQRGFNNRVKAGASITIIPFIIGMLLYVITCVWFQLYTYYFTDQYWSDTAVLKSKGECSSGYESWCSRLVFRSISSDDRIVFHWYDNSAQIRSSAGPGVGSLVVLKGYGGFWGGIVERIEWEL